MAITRERKEELLEQYITLINNSKAVFWAEYKGMSVKHLQNLRNEVRKADGAFYVTKNTLLRKALEETGHPIPEGLLIGQMATGFAMGEVPTLAKTLVDFAKEAEMFQMKGGILSKRILSGDEVQALAKLPSLDELRGQIVGLISAPARNIAGTLAGGVRQLVNVVDAYAKSEASADAASADAASANAAAA